MDNAGYQSIGIYALGVAIHDISNIYSCQLLLQSLFPHRTVSGTGQEPTDEDKPDTIDEISLETTDVQREKISDAKKNHGPAKHPAHITGDYGGGAQALSYPPYNRTKDPSSVQRKT